MRRKHKEENVFKFKNFSERISEVDLRSLAFYRIEHVNEIPDENRSHFYQCLEKWSVLNLTEEYAVFEKQFKAIQTATLPQVLHHKDKIIDILLKRLVESSTLSLQPLLELTVALARDLREEFYIHFQTFFEKLIKLLNTKDADQTEWTLVCLAFLFKVLKPFLCKEISIVIQKILPLLSENHQPDHIINFSVECFAFLVKNLRDKNNFLLMLLKTVKQEDSYVMGCGKLFFEMIRGLNGQFHSKGEEFLTVLFDAFRKKQEYEKYFDILKEILVQTVGDIFNYIDNNHMSTYWSVLFKSFEAIIASKDLSSIDYMLHFLGQSIEYHGGKKVSDVPKLIDLIIKIIDMGLPLESMMIVTQIASVILLSKNFTLSQLDASRLAKKITNSSYVQVFETFVRNSIYCPQFDFLIMPDFIKYFEQNLTISNMEVLARIIEKRRPNELLNCSEKFNSYNLRLKKETVDAIVMKIINGNDRDEFLLAIKIYPHISTLADRSVVEKHLKEKNEGLLRNLAQTENVYFLAVNLSAIHILSSSSSPEKITQMLNAMLELREKSYSVLKVIKFLIDLLKPKHQSQLDQELFTKIRSTIVDNLYSQYHQIRLLTTQILSSFDHLQDESIYAIFNEIEEIVPSIATYRDQILLLQKLNHENLSNMSNELVEDALKFCLGFLHINFQPLWETVFGIIESHIGNFDINVVWKVFHHQLKDVVCCKEEISETTLSEIEFINEKFKDFSTVTDRYDPIAYRVKLLKILSDSRSSVCDVKQRDIVELFFDFFKNEYNIVSDDAPKGRQKLLISHLQVLAKFTNPRCVTKGKELHKLYIGLLLHRNFQVQKLALDCILHYNEPAVANNKEILLNCVSEKSFRQEILTLNLNEKIQSDREGFSEIFLPILYSKLTVKAGKNDQESFKNKKEVIVRFMNHLKEEELLHLTEIATGKLQKIENVEDIKNDCLKVSELQSMLEFIDMLRRNVAGAFSENYQRKLLQSTLSIACYTLDKDGAMWKSLKQSCLHSVTEFFDQYESYCWTDGEIKLLYGVFIWQYLETFSKDASQNVTNLMKLFIVWSKNPIYFHYLEKSNFDGNRAIKSIIGLLSNKQTTSSVTECVLDIIERLLNLKSDDEVIATVNYGTQLIEPFICIILTKLKSFLNIKRVKAISARNLFVLERVTELVNDKESSKILLDILFPLTLRKCIEDKHDGDGMMKLLHTISNLLKAIDDMSLSYLRSFAPLFEHIQEVNQRKFLVKIFPLVTRDENLIALVGDLNAFDRRWIEQPDFERRLSAFHKIEKNDEVTIDLAVIVIFHCFYFLKHEKDLGIRDNSSHHLKQICGKVITNLKDDKQQIDYFVDKIVLNLIQKRIHENDASIKTESIQFLGELARNHHQVHPVLRDLHALTNSANRELDFFDNITHLQKFRHMKALRRFVEVANGPEQPSYNLRTLNDFLLPLSKAFLCTEEYQRRSKVIEAAIDYVACICKFLPWNQYEMVLKNYMRKMKNDSKAYQRQLVKLIPAILDSFHFQFSNANDELITEEVKNNIDEKDGDEEEEVDIENQDEDAQSIIDEEEIVNEKNYTMILRPNVTQRVIRSLTRTLIPSLFRIISELSTTTAHKLNKEERRLKEKADMIRIPIALPLIKLLQKLPPQFLKQYLSQVVLKVSTFLRSSLKQVRATTRHVLKEILLALGVAHLETVIGNLSSILCKGFQVHVLSITIHTLIDTLKNQLTCEITDKILQKIIEICFNDIFGKINEEQEIGKIGHRTPEAKPSRKTFLTLSIMASNISEKCILDLLMPFKQKLVETQSKKTVTKIQDCMVQIAVGLTSNVNIPIEALMILIHGTISESIPSLLPEKKKKSDVKQIKRVDCFIIQEEPKRRGAMNGNAYVKASKMTNTYVLVEFGLEMLHAMMKKKRFEAAEPFLDPLVTLLLDSLRSNFIRVNTFAVRCLSIMWHHKLELEHLKLNAEAIASEVFSILHKYATTEISRKDNHYLLVKSCFKCVLALVRNVDYYTLNSNQLKALFLYIEQDLLTANDKDTISFVLLKAILDRKLIVPETAEIMRKVAEMSITSEVEEKRAAIRPIMLTYLMEYPLGKKIETMLKFFIAQLNYEEISGRESAIAMMSLIFKHFPQEHLAKQSGLFFLALATRLVNDDSPVCREKIADALELLIKQLPNNTREQNYSIVVALLKDKKLVHREMAAQLIIRFINACSSEFVAPKIPCLLKLLLTSLDAYNDEEVGKFVRVKRAKIDDDEADDDDDDRDQQTIEDHHTIQTLNAIIKIIEYENAIKNVEIQSTINEIGFKAHTLIPHDHVWVRLNALKIIKLIIKSLDVEKILNRLKNQEISQEDDKFLHSKSQFQSMTFDMCVQIKPGVDQVLLDSILDLLLEVAKIIKDIAIVGGFSDKKDFNLLWLIRRLRYAVHAEIATTPSIPVLRKAIFHFFNNLMEVIDKRMIIKLSNSMLTPMLREMVEGEHVIDELKQVAMQVGNRIKTIIGLQEYDKIRLELQSKMLRKRVNRRKSLAQEKINNPVKAATRNIMKQLKKQDNKKRKRRDIQEGIILPHKKRRIFSNAMNDTYE